MSLDKNDSMLAPAILSISLLTIMASSAVSPALPAIKNAFPDVDSTLIKLILTLPSLIIIPFSLMSGWLVTKIDKKTILFTGLSIYLVAGVGGGFANNITTLLIIRGVLGVGIGLIMPLSTTLIIDLFDASKRAKIMGLQASVNQFGGMLFLAVSGWLACFSWRYAFGVYSLAIVTMVMIAIWLPSLPKSDGKNIEKSKTDAKLHPGIFGIAFVGMVMMIVFFVVSTDLGLFIQSEKSVFTSNTKMFVDKSDLVTHLENGTVSEMTKNLFKENGIKISDNSKLEKTENKFEWKITDGTKRFIIKKDNNKLAVSVTQGTPAIVGYALAFLTFSGIFAGLILNFLFKKIGFYLVPLAAILMGIGFFILAISSNLFTIFAAMPFIGLGGGLMTPPLMLKLPTLVAPQMRAFAIAIVSSSIMFGQFLSPVVLKWVTVIGHNNSFRFKFNFLSLFLIISSLLAMVIMTLFFRKENSKVEK